jgi:FkbM family methyltransferase
MNSSDRNLSDRLLAWANRTLAPAGLSLKKTETRWVWGNPTVRAQVGRFQIDVPHLNPISTHYLSHPNYSGHIGRLATLIRRKYPHLAAIDVGANVGDTACIIKTAEDIPILCIEGDAYTFAFLQTNLKQLKQVTAHKLFVGEKTEVIAARTVNTGWNTTIVPQTNGPTSLQITKMDDFLEKQPEISNYKLFKIDAEGFDCAIVRGSQKYIQDVSPVITFEYNRGNMKVIGESGLETLLMLRRFGYNRIVYHDFFGRYLCASDFSDTDLVSDLHDYLGDKDQPLFYCDVTLFHNTDEKLGLEFTRAERALHRAGTLVY